MRSSKSSFKRFYLDHGLSPDLAESYSVYAANLRDQKFPVLFEVNHLSLRMRLSRELIGKAINSPENLYRCFEIKKKVGGVRKIVAPYPSLQQAQLWIKRKILDNFELSDHATAFKKGSSVIDNARVHADRKAVLCMDIKDFFPSITKNWIIQVFKEIGYSHQMAFYLASICCYDGALPQGAPTSPGLSNIVCRYLDRRLSGLAGSAGLNYTRYADDLTFSGDYISQSFPVLIEKIVSSCGFSPNGGKTRLMLSPARKVVTGINVARPRLSLSNKYKKEIKKEVYYIEKFGLRSHLSKKKIRDPLYIDRLIGKANYWSEVESWNGEPKEILQILCTAKQRL